MQVAASPSIINVSSADRVGSAAIARANNVAQSIQPTNDIAGQISQIRQSAAPGTPVIVNYQYTTAPDGSVRVSGATVQTTVREDAPTQNSNSEEAAAQSSASTVPSTDAPVVGGSSRPDADSFSRLTPEERELVRELRAIDSQVRVHEAQHLRASGGLSVGGISYEFVQGPDGQFYAVAGAVNIQTSGTSDPAQQAREAQTFALAATAPADASAQDIAVARDALNRAASAYNASARLAPEAANQSTEDSAVDSADALDEIAEEERAEDIRTPLSV